MGNVNEVCAAPCNFDETTHARSKDLNPPKPFGLPPLEALRKPPVQSNHDPSSSARVPFEISREISARGSQSHSSLPLSPRIPAPSSRYSQDELREMYEAQQRRKLASSSSSSSTSQETSRGVTLENKSHTGALTAWSGGQPDSSGGHGAASGGTGEFKVAVRLPKADGGIVGMCNTTPEILVAMKSYRPPNLPDSSVSAGEVCTVFREGTNGWILVLKPCNKLAWMPKSYAKIFEGFACQYPSNGVQRGREQGVVYFAIPSPQAERVREAVALAAEDECRALKSASG